MDYKKLLKKELAGTGATAQKPSSQALKYTDRHSYEIPALPKAGNSDRLDTGHAYATGRSFDTPAGGTAAPAQLFNKDRKKAKWKEQGPQGWKHGRKAAAGRKSASEDAGRLIPHAVVSDRLRDAGFDETHYIDHLMLLLSLYSENPETEQEQDARKHEIESIIQKFGSREEQEQDPNVAIFSVIDRNASRIIQDFPAVRARVTSTGNCGALANFLFESREDEVIRDGDFELLKRELEEKLNPGKIKLIMVNANIGHAFTLICYAQKEHTVVELIQAWQGEYSVSKSLEKTNANIYINTDLISMFVEMNRDLTSKTGIRFFQQLFLMPAPKAGIDKFQIEKCNVKILNESPEQYAERISQKSLSS